MPYAEPSVRTRCSLKPSWADDAVCGTVRKNEVFTIVEGPITVGNGRMYKLITVGNGRMYKLKSGAYITAAEKYVDVYEK